MYADPYRKHADRDVHRKHPQQSPARFSTVKRNQTMHIVALLLPGFAPLPLAILKALTLQACLQQSKRKVILHLMTPTGCSVSDADGEIRPPTKSNWADVPLADTVLMLTGPSPTSHLPLGMRGYLHRLKHMRTAMYADHGGMQILAHLKWDDEASIPARRIPPTLGAGPILLDEFARHIGGSEAASLALAVGIDWRGAPNQRMDFAATDPILKEMLGIMRNNLAKPLLLEEIARRLDLSEKQLRSKCRNGFGQAPGQIYLMQRMKFARHLVETTILPVAHIAEKSGFTSPSSFTRCFRSSFGQTPRELRARQRRAA